MGMEGSLRERVTGSPGHLNSTQEHRMHAQNAGETARNTLCSHKRGLLSHRMLNILYCTIAIISRTYFDEGVVTIIAIRQISKIPLSYTSQIIRYFPRKKDLNKDETMRAMYEKSSSSV